MSNFKVEGRTICWKLIDYLKMLTERESKFEDSYLIKFIRKVLIEKIEPNVDEIQEFETKLETAFDLFLQDLTTKNLFSEIKDDYFKI